MLVTSNNLDEGFWLQIVRRIILTRQTIINGPEAMKLFEKRLGFLGPPQDVSNRPECRTVYVNVGGCSEQELRDKFNAHCEIESVRMLARGAQITYTTREGADKASEKCLSWQ